METLQNCDVCARESSPFLSIKKVDSNYICQSCRNNFYKISNKLIQAIVKSLKCVSPEQLVKCIFSFLANPKDCNKSIEWKNGKDSLCENYCDSRVKLCKQCRFRKSVFMFRLPDSKYKSSKPFSEVIYNQIQREWFGILDKVKIFDPETTNQTEKLSLKRHYSENDDKKQLKIQVLNHHSIKSNEEICNFKHEIILNKIQNTPMFVNYLSNFVNNKVVKRSPGVHGVLLKEAKETGDGDKNASWMSWMEWAQQATPWYYQKHKEFYVQLLRSMLMNARGSLNTGSLNERESYSKLSELIYDALEF